MSSREIANALHQAIVTGDVTALAEHLADDALVWHNSDRLELGTQASLERIGAVSHIASDVRLEVVRFSETDFGFVEQTVLRATINASGRTIELHNCLAVTVSQGRIVRIDEYVDPNVATQMTPG